MPCAFAASHFNSSCNTSHSKSPSLMSSHKRGLWRRRNKQQKQQQQEYVCVTLCVCGANMWTGSVRLNIHCVDSVYSMFALVTYKWRGMKTWTRRSWGKRIVLRGREQAQLLVPVKCWKDFIYWSCTLFVMPLLFFVMILAYRCSMVIISVDISLR